MTRLRIDLAYDGAPFHGFARQPELTTVQGVLEDALSRVLDQPAESTCAGRTDKGVHALAQVVHVDVDPQIPAAARALDDLAVLAARLHRMAGPAITVWAVDRVPDDFDARFSATERRYRYRLVDAALLSPLRRHTVWHVGEPLRIQAMREAARHLLGEHDFASFCRAPKTGTTIRRLDHVAVSRSGDEIQVRLRGPAFCHQQVRSVVAALVEVGRGRREPGWVAEVLEARDRSAVPALAPPHGLVLEGVSYGRRYPSAPPRAVRPWARPSDGPGPFGGP